VQHSISKGLEPPKYSIVLLLWAVVGIAACSTAPPENQRPVHPVRGRVTFQGKPAKGVFVLFVPVNEPAEAVDPRPRAETEEDGSFSLSTYGENDGAPLGEYIVTMSWQGGVRPDGSEEPPDKLLGRYAEVGKSKLRASVKEGPNELPPFQLQ
jgi:hypothetical protein